LSATREWMKNIIQVRMIQRDKINNVVGAKCRGEVGTEFGTGKEKRSISPTPQTILIEYIVLENN